ncbi:MAG: cysteine desulfurase [Alphaproteobacteria bacterium]|nr:MAG: cysteine desulfurase [Alphaproteobacteria bacterium]
MTARPAPIYLDHNASAPLCPQAAQAMTQAMGMLGNPSSIHAPGKAARRLIEEARAAVAALIGALPEQIVFTSGGTEANALALAQAQGPVWVSAIEHDSVLRGASEARLLPVVPSGILDLGSLSDALTHDKPGLVSVMLANNETGVLQPVAQAARMIRDRSPGTLIHTDAVQVVGRMGLNLAELGADMLSLSAHKLGGPQGVGALVILREEMAFAPLLRGGGQEGRKRAGTENLIGIAGFGAAAAQTQTCAHLAGLRDDMEQRLRQVAPDIQIFGHSQPRLPNTSCLAIPGLPSATQIMALDLEGIAISAGAACSSGKLAPSHVLRAMQVPDDLAGCAIRISLGAKTNAADIDRLVEVETLLIQRHRKASS